MSIATQVKRFVNNPLYKSVGIYVFTNFFSKGVSFILIPLFTNPKYLTPTDNGILSLFSSNMILIAPFITLGMIQSSAADYFKKSKADFSASFTSHFFMAGLMTIISMLGLYLFKDALWEKFALPVSFVFIIPALAFLVFCSEQLFALVRNRNEVSRYALIGISKALIEYSLAVVLIVFFFTGWEGRIWGIGISLITVNLAGVWYYTKNHYISFSFNREHLLEELKFGVPIFVFQLCVFMLGATNKLFLAIFDVDKHELGIYAIACILGTMVGTVAQSILLYIQPELYKLLSSGKASFDSARRIFFNYIKMLTVLSVICVGVGVFAYYFLINQIYLSGLKYFFVAALASFIWGLNYFFFLFLLYNKEKRKILLISTFSIFCSVIINTLMVKYFLIWGDALSSLINTLIFSLLVIFFTKHIIVKSLKNKGTEHIIIPPHHEESANQLGNQPMRILAPIAFFAYNRPEHTRQVLESLYHNRYADQSSLYIYVDGPKPGANETTLAAIAAVKEIVREKKWCKEVTIIESEVNKGLVRSTTEGVTNLVNEFGKVIAMEDDGLVSPGFLTYMNDALDFYENNPRVMHISAYARPDLAGAVVDQPTYFFYHTTTWGWGTWKRAWDNFTLDALAVREAVKKKGNIRKLNMNGTYQFFWGLQAVANSKIKSWNTIWHSVVFLNDGLVLYPKRSLVSNIGHDGSGTNCAPDDRFQINDEMLALEVPVTAIPLAEHEAVRKHYVGLHSFGYRLKFAIKHYLRYLINKN